MMSQTFTSPAILMYTQNHYYSSLSVINGAVFSPEIFSGGKFLSTISSAAARQLLSVYSTVVVVVAMITYLVTIMESVDSISRDGPDTPIYVIHNKNLSPTIVLRCLSYRNLMYG